MMIKLLAQYHRWAYQQLYASLKIISDDQYHKDVGLFFKSIHGTLNHLLLVDKLWLSRLKKESFIVTSLNEELISDRVKLETSIINQANAWVDFITSIVQNPLPDFLDYTNTKGIAQQVPYEKVLYHVFNHGTHHRGQITTVLTQLGLEPPMMDLIYFQEEV